MNKITFIRDKYRNNVKNNGEPMKSIIIIHIAILTMATLNVYSAAISPAQLHLAVQNGNMRQLQALVNTEIPTLINAQYEDQKTLLHMACFYGYREIVNFLIQAGAHIEAQDKNKKTALHYAAESGQADIVRILIQAGANIEAQDSWDWTPIHYAAQNGHIKVVEILISYNANIEAKTFWCRWTPLHCAVANRDLISIRLLINAGANVNARTYYDQETPLHLAAHRNYGDIIEILIRSGAAIDTRNVRHETALYIAVKENNVQSVEALLRMAGYPPYHQLTDAEKDALFQ